MHDGDAMLAPKVIHYIWLGGKPLSTLGEKCLSSWHKYAPEFEIRKWDETNLDVDLYAYTREAYAKRKYAFVSDFFRMKILYEQGGVYMDTDSELLKPIDDLLEKDFVVGTESNNANIGIIAGFFCAKPSINVVGELWGLMKNASYPSDNATVLMPLLDNYYMPKIKKLPTSGFVHIGQSTVYAPEYFSAKDNSLGKYMITKNTYAVHHYDSSWRRFGSAKKLIKNILQPEGMAVLRKVLNLK